MPPFMKVVYKSHVNMNKLKTVKISIIISGVLKTHGVKAARFSIFHSVDYWEGYFDDLNDAVITVMKMFW